ncbi:MAG: hypothetical protein WAU88_08865, partial [Candidatus Zixiibacteriota bacterium]
VMSLLLYAYLNYFSPVFYPLAKATVILAGKEATERFFHYPGHFLYLPAVFGWSKTLVAILFDGLFLGSAALLLRQEYLGRGNSTASRDRSLLSSWGHLILASFSFNLLIFAAGFLLPMALQPILAGYARRSLMFEFIILPAVYSLILAIFFLVIPRIALYGESFIRALGRSWKSFLKRPLTSFFLAGVILFVPILIATIANHSDIIIAKFYPELVFWILWVGLGADLLANFLWMGTSVRLLVDSES